MVGIVKTSAGHVFVLYRRAVNRYLVEMFYLKKMKSFVKFSIFHSRSQSVYIICYDFYAAGAADGERQAEANRDQLAVFETIPKRCTRCRCRNRVSPMGGDSQTAEGGKGRGSVVMSQCPFEPKSHCSIADRLQLRFILAPDEWVLKLMRARGYRPMDYVVARSADITSTNWQPVARRNRCRE